MDLFVWLRMGKRHAAIGGINGRKVKLVQVSDNGSSTRTKDAVRRLFE